MSGSEHLGGLNDLNKPDNITGLNDLNTFDLVKSNISVLHSLSSEGGLNSTEISGVYSRNK